MTSSSSSQVVRQRPLPNSSTTVRIVTLLLFVFVSSIHNNSNVLLVIHGKEETNNNLRNIKLYNITRDDRYSSRNNATQREQQRTLQFSHTTLGIARENNDDPPQQQQTYHMNNLPHSIDTIVVGTPSKFIHEWKQQHQQHQSSQQQQFPNWYIPEPFASDQMTFSLNDVIRRPFPRWDSTSITSSSNTSIVDSIIDIVSHEQSVFEQYYNDIEIDNPNNNENNNENSNMEPFGKQRQHLVNTLDHLRETTVNWWFPETLYILQNNGVQVSHRAKKISNMGTNSVPFKINPTETIMKYAYQILSSQPSQSSQSQQHPPTKDEIQLWWPKLYDLIIQKNGSVPFLAHYGDFTGCNYQNYHSPNAIASSSSSSVPLFTVAAPVTCNHTFPFPNYRTARYHMKESSTDWYDGQSPTSLTYHQQRYPPYKDKISKIIWRGSLTGNFAFDGMKRPPRYHLLKLVHSNTSLSQDQRSMFNIKLTSIPKKTQRLSYIDPKELGGIDPMHRMKMIDFQNYKAIIDIDGHSWSSRFGDLLCYSSVILKIEPEYVDYFYYPSKISIERNKYIHQKYSQSNQNNNSDDDNDITLKPWKHYIPIKADLSDLIDKSSYVLDAKNNQHIESIIRNANQWCIQRMINNVVAYDALDIWENYIQVLDESSATSNSDWRQKWNTIKDTIMNGPLEMVPI